jgi:RNA polymerase sigma factor (sigma-70 family)
LTCSCGRSTGQFLPALPPSAHEVEAEVTTAAKQPRLAGLQNKSMKRPGPGSSKIAGEGSSKNGEDMATSQMSEFIQRLRRTALLRDGAGLTDGQLLENYISRRDEAALAALVRRHAPMVWGVCHRVLCNHHDAEDAFQAAFLVFVRKAASIASRELLANWLYGVAHQTALKARATMAKRRAREKQVKEIPEVAVAEQDLWNDLRPLLDQELSRLPDKYRVAIVLCDLEGKTRKEVARRLKIPAGTLSSRLTTARTMLAKRLARHGLAVSGGALATMLSQKVASAGVPTSVLASTIKTASLFSVGKAATKGMISVKVAALIEGMLKSMFITKLKTVMAALLVVLGVVAFGGGLYRHQAAAQQGPGEKPPVQGEKDAQARPSVAKTLKNDKEKLQGTWLMVSGVANGDALSDEAVKDRKVVIEDDKITELERGKKLIPSDFVLDTTRDPKAIDAIPLEGGFKGMKHRGIYALVGDSLKLCFSKAGDIRPIAFICEKGSQRVLLVYKRDTPKKDKDDAKKPMKEAKEGTLEAHLEKVDAKEGVITVSRLGTIVSGTGEIKEGKIRYGMGFFKNNLRLENLPVARNARVIVDGEQGKLADLKPDMNVTLQLEVKGIITVKEISARGNTGK